MWNLRQSTLLAAIVSAGLLSALICQCPMQIAIADPASHHCDPEEENGAVESCCCVMTAAEPQVVKAFVVMPEALQTDLVEMIVEIRPLAPLVPAKLPHPPPVNCGILHQTCALLI